MNNTMKFEEILPLLRQGKSARSKYMQDGQSIKIGKVTELATGNVREELMFGQKNPNAPSGIVWTLYPADMNILESAWEIID